MAKVIVNDVTVELKDDERLNGIQVARQAGFDIPHYCWHPGLSVVASCRMCLVESGRCDAETGEISMMPKLVPACQTPAMDGSVFVTESEKVHRARAQVEEALLIDHPIDCPVCDKAGECNLQDYHFKHGQEQRRADIRPFTSRRRSLGDTVTLFVDRCVMCSRCVRFCREISGTSELMVTGRGSGEEIDVFPGFPLENKLSGNVVDLCPVGALGDKDFLYSQRVWFMQNRPGVCAGCSTGCSIQIDENQDRVYRIRPRENPQVNHWWICDEGRYGFHGVHDENRFTLPSQRQQEQWVPLEWESVCEELQGAMSRAERPAVVVSPFLTVEEAYLLVTYARQVQPNVTCVLGHIPSRGVDETFPNGFCISAEKCPNRRGVEEVLKHGRQRLIDWDGFMQQCDAEPFDMIWLSGGYSQDWINADDLSRLSSASYLIQHDLLPSAISELAHMRLPEVAFAERDGSYVNRDDVLQSFGWAVRSPAGVWSTGQLCWRLLQRSGLYDAPAVLAEMAQEIPYFSVALPPVPEHGIDLKINQLVES
ncbi:MAG: 2Fe-2S iron-sulfur cluster-binding protein [Pirellulaceae bacterium]|nr:2Fe-2S iron-sulfur cluster-binding protein [Pirellulaceae bacterium]